MSTPVSHSTRVQPSSSAAPAPPHSGPKVILSFDVEEHDRIEAASHLDVSASLKLHYRDRMVAATEWILEQLDKRHLLATFFIVGEIARKRPALIQAIASAGHEVASHGWDHRRVLTMSPDEFREDLKRSREALEEASGTAVVGYRAPTFSITRANPWAIDVLARAGFQYDSSIVPIRGHDRYGVPGSPRAPYHVRGHEHTLLELPPLTWKLGPFTIPVGGGGYFRLFPLAMLEAGLRQASKQLMNLHSTLYLHPWEFDPSQRRLPLKGLSAFRTYVGLNRSRPKLLRLLDRHPCTRALDAFASLASLPLPTFNLEPESL